MKIGMTTGCYDLFHFGHANQINQCKCDFLFVAVASDWLVKVQKGEGRPVDGEALRRKNVQNYLESNKIKGQAFITDLLDFNGLEMIDLFFVGEDQRNVRWNGPKFITKRTPGISTGMLIKKGGH